MPYEPEPPFDTRFDPEYEGAYAHRIDYGPISKGDMTYRNPLSASEMAHVKTLYDGEVATADRALGRLLREMERSGDLENTVVVATADHGESLDENGYFLNHGDFVYGPATNIPMVIVPAAGDPAGVGGTAEGAGVDRVPMSLVDVAPLLLHAADVDVPDGGMDGRVPTAGRRALFGESGFCRFPQLNDRLGWLLPQEIAQSPEAVPDWKERWEEQANRAKQRFLRTGRSKLVLSPRPDGDRWEWFDLRTDPGERHALDGTTAGAEADSLRAALTAWIAIGRASSGTAEARTLSAEERERLQALGYLGN
jgi:Sulfatase